MGQESAPEHHDPEQPPAESSAPPRSAREPLLRSMLRRPPVPRSPEAAHERSLREALRAARRRRRDSRPQDGWWEADLPRIGSEPAEDR